MMESSTPDLGAPIPDEVERITKAVLEGIGDADLESALTVLCGISGQLIANLSEGNLAKAAEQSQTMGLNIRRAATAKLLYDSERRREELLAARSASKETKQ